MTKIHDVYTESHIMLASQASGHWLGVVLLALVCLGRFLCPAHSSGKEATRTRAHTRSVGDHRLWLQLMAMLHEWNFFFMHITLKRTNRTPLIHHICQRLCACVWFEKRTNLNTHWMIRTARAGFLCSFSRRCDDATMRRSVVLFFASFVFV